MLRKDIHTYDDRFSGGLKKACNPGDEVEVNGGMAGYQCLLVHLM